MEEAAEGGCEAAGGMPGAGEPNVKDCAADGAAAGAGGAGLPNEKARGALAAPTAVVDAVVDTAGAGVLGAAGTIAGALKVLLICGTKGDGDANAAVDALGAILGLIGGSAKEKGAASAALIAGAADPSRDDDTALEVSIAAPLRCQ